MDTSTSADIAFLLLVFFLMTSVIDSEHGIKSTISKPFQQPDSIQLSKHIVLVNNQGSISVGDKLFSSGSLVDGLIKEYGENPWITQAVVVKTERNVGYEDFIQTLDKIKGSFKRYHNEKALLMYGKPLAECKPNEQRSLRKKYPVALAEEVVDF